jgi:transposase
MEAGMAGIAITRTEFTATEMRAAAGKTKHARAARRMLAIALVIEGANRKTAAETCGMDRQTLRGEEDAETVRGTVFPTNGHRYNAEGLEGLTNRHSAGPAPRLSPNQKAELAQMVREGPDPAVDGVVRLAAR